MNISNASHAATGRNQTPPCLRGGLPAALLCIALAAIVFSSPSYAQTQTQDEDQASSPAALKKLSLDQLMDIEVTSVSKEPEPYEQAPAAIDVITQDEIRRSGASSIPEALRLADSLDVAQKNSHDWAISSRGFDTDLSNKLLVLMDGRSVYTPLYSGVFWDVQDYLMADINQIEVISGPGGTLWGANAVNGVINITTKSARDTQGFYTETGGGSMLRDFIGARYGGVLAPNVYYRVYGKYFNRGHEMNTNGTAANDSWKQARGGFRIDAYPTTENTFTLQGDYYGGTEGIDTGGRARVSGGNVLGRWSHVFSDDSNMSLQAYYDHTYLSDPIPGASVAGIPLTPAGTLTDGLHTYDIDFQHHLTVGNRNHVSWGLGYRYTRDVVGNAPSLSFSPTTLRQNLFSGFIQDEIMITKDLHFTIGTKLEHNDYTGFEVEPSARIQWNVAHDQMIWGAISRAVRTPSRIDRDFSEPNPANSPIIILKGNTNFVSEKLIAYETGYRAKFGKKIGTSVSLYYNKYDDIRSTSTTPGTILPFYFENNLEGQSYGAELSVDYQLCDWWRLHGGYTFIDEHLTVKQGKSDLSNAHNETADPRNQFTLRSSMDLPHNVELDASLRWVDKLHNNNGPNVGTVPGYMELDVRLGWHPTDRLELSVVGENLLQNRHPEYGYPDPDREEIVRGVYGKVAWEF